jgi:hypothetical protein
MAMLYRVWEQAPGTFISSAEFFSMLFAEEVATRPENDYVRVIEWFCTNEDCVVREVRIRCKYIDAPAPRKLPTMRCPSCGQAMDPRHLLRTIKLIPVKGEQTCGQQTEA